MTQAHSTFTTSLGDVVVVVDSSVCAPPFVIEVLAWAPFVTGVAVGSGLPSGAPAARLCKALHRLSNFWFFFVYNIKY